MGLMAQSGVTQCPDNFKGRSSPAILTLRVLQPNISKLLHKGMTAVSDLLI